MLEAASIGLDCQTRQTRNAQEALVYIQSHRVTLTVVDQDVSDGNGIALLAQIRELAPFTERALVVNEKADVHVAMDALNKSCVSLLLRKPLTDPRIIRKGLREAMSAHRRQVRDELKPPTPEQTDTTLMERTQRLERLYTVGEIASGLIHQFNNILTIMNGHMELLMGDLTDPHHLSRAQTILKAGQDGARLTRSIQDFMRSNNAQTEFFQLNRLISETLKMTEPIWKSRRTTSGRPIEICTELQEVPTLQGNPGELREALTNLVLNAIDAMPKGGTLTIRTTYKADEVFIEVEDSGIGMSESIRRRIFDPFFTTKGERGNGLGLGIVRRIIREHGGDIEVRSQPGKGTCFTLTIPALKTNPSNGIHKTATMTLT
jgi:signal transduction histidine kinase